MFRLTILALTASAVTLSGCAALVTKAAIDPNAEVSVTRTLRDVTAARAIKARMLRIEGHDLNDVSVDVVNGVVVLSGAAPKAIDKKEAERIAWSAPGVSKVGNEIYVGRSLGLFSKTKDEAVTTAVRTRLATSNNVRNLNYNIETRDGVVYLLGVARDKAELSEAARLASITRGVREVVSYVSVKNDMPNAYGTGNSGAASGESVSHNAPYVSAPSASVTTQEDLSFWGEPTDSAPTENVSLSDPMPYSAPIDNAAPLPYRPGITELDADALNSGKPVLRDVETGEIIVLPEGVEAMPYQKPSIGGLGAGGAPLPPGAIAQTTLPAAIAAPQNIAKAPLASPQDPGPMAGQDGESITLSKPYTVDPNTGKRIDVRWDGDQWVGLIK